MSDKSAQKKKYIVETARKVFMEKGYKTVTMKDIVEACEISRAGLYLYFENTSQIFLEVLLWNRKMRMMFLKERLPEKQHRLPFLLCF